MVASCASLNQCLHVYTIHLDWTVVRVCVCVCVWLVVCVVRCTIDAVWSFRKICLYLLVLELPMYTEIWRGCVCFRLILYVCVAGLMENDQDCSGARDKHVAQSFEKNIPIFHTPGKRVLWLCVCLCVWLRMLQHMHYTTIGSYFFYFHFVNTKKNRLFFINNFTKSMLTKNTSGGVMNLSYATWTVDFVGCLFFCCFLLLLLLWTGTQCDNNVYIMHSYLCLY